MKDHLFLAFGALLGVAGLSSAQTPAAPPNPLTTLPADGAAGCGVDGSFACPCECAPSGPHVWAEGEPLLWWLKSAPVSVPLLSTFTPNSPSATTGFGGALGVPGTTVLTPDHLGYGPFFGGRMTAGGWIDGEQRLGLEGNGFLLETRTASSGAMSDGNGSPPLRALFVNTPPGAGFPPGESSFVLADPGFAAGGQVIDSTIRLWGAEANALYRLGNGDTFRLTALGGFRYLDLQEGLSILDTETILGVGNYTGLDQFRTRNQFYGGQLGARADVRYEWLFAALQAKVALGATHESVNVGGLSTATLAGSPTGAPGGIYAQPSNSGRTTRNDFAVVPDLQVRAGANLTRNVRFFVGYDFLYVSSVVRPGDQIDRTLNFTQNAVLNGAGSVLTGAARPAPLFHTSDFWAQGCSVGFEIRY